MATQLPHAIAVLALLAVLPLPQASAQFSQVPSSPVEPLEGSSTALVCEYPAAFTIQWKHNSSTILNGNEWFTVAHNAGMSTLTLVNADHLHHNGEYSCIAVFFDSSTVSHHFNVTVRYLNLDISIRRIHTECTPVIYNGYPFTLECVPPAGYPQVSVTWYLFDNKIRQNAGDPAVDFSNSRRRLTITEATSNHIGEYHCEASNQAGRRMSSNVRINVLDPNHGTEDGNVSIVSSQRPLLVGGGRNTKLLCQVIPIPTDINRVCWFHDAVQVRHDAADGDYRITQDLHQPCFVTLHIDNVTAAKEGRYICSHVGEGEVCSFNGASHAQRLLLIARLSGPLVVVATPSSLVGQNQTVSLECRLGEGAEETSTIPRKELSYSWTVNGVAITSDAKHELREGGKVLVITATSLSQSGSYSCMASHSELATPITGSTNITVEPPPPLTLSSPSSRVQLGSLVTLHCLSSSPRSSSFSWQRNDTLIASNGRHTIFSSTNSSSLTIRNLQLVDLQLYWCMANDSVHGRRDVSLQLTEAAGLYVVGGASTAPVAMQFRNGTTLMLACITRGGPGTEVDWYRGENQIGNGTKLGAGRAFVVARGNESVLNVSKVVTSGAGLYSCAVSDPITRLESQREFSITITVPGRIVSVSDSMVTAEIGSRVQFDCFTYGIPTPTVNWLFKLQPISNLVSSIHDLGNGSLVISPVHGDLEGQYHCLVGTNNSIFTLEVVEDEEEGGGNCIGLSQTECIILFTVCALALVLLLFSVAIILICACSVFKQQKKETHSVSRDSDMLEMKRNDSSRASLRKDNSGIFLSGTPANSFFGGQFPVNHYVYSASVPISPCVGSEISELRDSLSPPAPSLAPQTLQSHGTDSIFSSEDGTSLVSALPNFPRSNLQLDEEMGEGEFGPVFVGVARSILSHEEQTQVAVKVLVRGGESEDHFRPDLALVDFANQMKLDHEHISCILGLCTDAEPYYVLYEYLDQGDLKRYLLSHRPLPDAPSSLSQEDLHHMVLQMADGMAYLFSQRIIHGDLAARNCLISSDHRVKIADLGVGHDLYYSDYYDNGSQLLPIRWMPPELLLPARAAGERRMREAGLAFSLHSDVWSFGVLCWEIFSFARLPYESWSDAEVQERVPRGELLEPPAEGCPAHLLSIMRQCWLAEPEDRPRFSKLCMSIMNMED